MTTVFLLRHEYAMPDGEEEIKELGSYSSRENALAAIERYKKLPGFRDYPNSFEVYESQLDMDAGWTDGFIVPDPHDSPLPGFEYDDHGFLRRKT